MARSFPMSGVVPAALGLTARGTTPTERGLTDTGKSAGAAAKSRLQASASGLIFSAWPGGAQLVQLLLRLVARARGFPSGALIDRITGRV